MRGTTDSARPAASEPRCSCRRGAVEKAKWGGRWRSPGPGATSQQGSGGTRAGPTKTPWRRCCSGCGSTVLRVCRCPSVSKASDRAGKI